MRTLVLFICCFLLWCCRAPSSVDAGIDAGAATVCWAPAGVVFTSAGETVLASTYLLTDGGLCFSAAKSYRLANVRDGGVVNLVVDDGRLRTIERLEGIFHLEMEAASDWWVTLQRLYFVRQAQGRTLQRTCSWGEPLIGGAFSCSGRIELPDGGRGPIADDWLQSGGVVYGLRDGGVVVLSSLGNESEFPALTEDVVSWAGDDTGLAVLGAGNVMSLYSADGGRRDFALPRDAGLGPVFRRAGLTYYSRSSIQFSGEICAVDTNEPRCVPGYVLAASGDEAWGPPALSGEEWLVVSYGFDGGWLVAEPALEFVAPAGWRPLAGIPRAMPSGVLVTSPNRSRALVWFGVHNGRDDMLLIDADGPLVAAGVRSSIAWASWDGGTLITE